jgi:hypothetical protein
MGDEEDDERTRQIRQQRGRRGNGKATMSPLKQREKSTKAHVHVFKHNLKALKRLQLERERLDAIAANEAGPSAPTGIRDGTLPNTPTDMLMVPEGCLALDGCLTSSDDIPEHPMDVDDVRAVDTPSFDDCPGSSISPFPELSFSAAAVEELDDPGTRTPPYSPCSLTNATIPLATSRDATTTLKDKKERGPTERSIADTKHWQALLPKIRAPFQLYLTQRYQATSSSFVEASQIDSDCRKECTRSKIEVDCLFLECTSSALRSSPIH